MTLRRGRATNVAACDDSHPRAANGERGDIPPKLHALALAVQDEGGRALLVGGCVRDHLLGRESKDWDVEVYGVEPAVLRELLARFGRVNTVGEAFTVYKLGRHIDVSIPRRERKQGRGHRGFVIEGDPTMSFEEAARRRDFTVNAILQDPLTGEIIDPYNGREDLRRGVLRHVAAETFVEDSLRVLRAAQFAARFNLEVHPDTLALCRSIPLNDLPAERIWGEMEKLLQAPRPSTGLRLLGALNIASQLFPELSALDEETSAHVFSVTDQARRLADEFSYPKRVAIMLAALCHRFSALDKVESFLDKLKIYTLENYNVRAQTLALVSEHRRSSEIYERREQSDADAAIRRLALRCELELLYRVARAIELVAREHADAAEWFIARARELGVAERPPARLLLGRHLLAMGLEPSPLIGEISDLVYELQLDGRITTFDEAARAAGETIAARRGSAP